MYDILCKLTENSKSSWSVEIDHTFNSHPDIFMKGTLKYVGILNTNHQYGTFSRHQSVEVPSHPSHSRRIYGRFSCKYMCLYLHSSAVCIPNHCSRTGSGSLSEYALPGSQTSRRSIYLSIPDSSGNGFFTL